MPSCIPARARSRDGSPTAKSNGLPRRPDFSPSSRSPAGAARDLVIVRAGVRLERRYAPVGVEAQDPRAVFEAKEKGFDCNGLQPNRVCNGRRMGVAALPFPEGQALVGASCAYASVQPANHNAMRYSVPHRRDAISHNEP